MWPPFFSELLLESHHLPLAPFSSLNLSLLDFIHVIWKCHFQAFGNASTFAWNTLLWPLSDYFVFITTCLIKIHPPMIPLLCTLKALYFLLPTSPLLIIVWDLLSSSLYSPLEHLYCSIPEKVQFLAHSRYAINICGAIIHISINICT